MFKKVLVTEDIDSINHAVSSVLKNFAIENIAYAQYCDKAYVIAKKAIKEGEPFDLLICDPCFKYDYREDKNGFPKHFNKVLNNSGFDLDVLLAVPE
jgi:23S rRNA A1618 N6-methylase RlmF